MSGFPPARGPGGTEEAENDPQQVLDPEKVARPIGQPSEAVIRQVLEASIFQGPYPPPEMMREYEEVCPGFAERAVTESEKQAQHRRDLEMLYAQANVKSEPRAQWMAFALSALLFVGGIIAVLDHQVIAGGLFVGGTAATIIGLFLAQQARNQRPPPRLSTRAPGPDVGDDSGTEDGYQGG